MTTTAKGPSETGTPPDLDAIAKDLATLRRDLETLWST